MENILTRSNASSEDQGVLAPHDGLLRGIVAALKRSRYGSGGKKMPVITGWDAGLESAKSILANEQYSSVFKDASKLAEATVTMIKQIAAREYRSDQRQHLARQRSHGRANDAAPADRARQVHGQADPARHRVLRRSPDAVKTYSSAAGLRATGPQPCRSQSTPRKPTQFRPGQLSPAPIFHCLPEGLNMDNTILRIRGITMELPVIQALTNVILHMWRAPRLLRGRPSHPTPSATPAQPAPRDLRASRWRMRSAKIPKPTRRRLRGP